MRTISEVLDRAKTVQKVKSDYKLALCLGIGESSLSAYRNGRGLPDEKTCQKLAFAMGEDPIILMVEMHAQRVKDDDSRAMWSALARRLQMGFLSLSFSITLAIVAIAASALPISTSSLSSSLKDSSLYIMLSTTKGLKSLFLILFVKLSKGLSFFSLLGINSHKYRVSTY